MYSTAKTLSVFAVIFGAIHAFMGVAVMIFASAMKLTFFQMFALCFYIGTSILVFILLICALRSLCSDLELEEEYSANRHVELKKRVEELEYRVTR